ncbi:MAG: hypothetical protein IT238_09875 [Bacteroidia bacterium]|nr:hypothetical protein [Bacteroidia bacterium]MCZ2247301.1 hypothetical protein [Bacteroidia bacterium]
MNITKKPSVSIKKKNMQTILDYCLDTKKEFTVLPKQGVDEWTIEINITDIYEAISFGMFLRENKLEANGVNPYVSPAKEQSQSKSKAEKQAESKILKDSSSALKQETESLLSLDSPAFEFEDSIEK